MTAALLRHLRAARAEAEALSAGGDTSLRFAARVLLCVLDDGISGVLNAEADDADAAPDPWALACERADRAREMVG